MEMSELSSMRLNVKSRRVTSKRFAALGKKNLIKYACSLMKYSFFKDSGF